MTDSAKNIDKIVLAKMAVIERCLIRIKEEYIGHETELTSNYTKQDSIILNLQRACEAAIDLGNYIIKMAQMRHAARLTLRVNSHQLSMN